MLRLTKSSRMINSCSTSHVSPPSCEAASRAGSRGVQIHGGYGYSKSYPIERYWRDARVTEIYEGTSEIMEWTIARDRWRSHLMTRGQYYAQLAPGLDQLHANEPTVGADMIAQSLRALNDILEYARANRLTRNQHILFRLGEWIALAETAAAMCRYAAGAFATSNTASGVHSYSEPVVRAMSRIYAREAGLRIVSEGLRWLIGSLDNTPTQELESALGLAAIYRAQEGLLADSDQVAQALANVEPV
mgnify:CR=1 FL=1